MQQQQQHGSSSLEMIKKNYSDDNTNNNNNSSTTNYNNRGNNNNNNNNNAKPNNDMQLENNQENGNGSGDNDNNMNKDDEKELLTTLLTKPILKQNQRNKLVDMFHSMKTNNDNLQGEIQQLKNNELKQHKNFQEVTLEFFRRFLGDQKIDDKYATDFDSALKTGGDAVLHHIMPELVAASMAAMSMHLNGNGGGQQQQQHSDPDVRARLLALDNLYMKSSPFIQNDMNINASTTLANTSSYQGSNKRTRVDPTTAVVPKNAGWNLVKYPTANAQTQAMMDKYGGIDKNITAGDILTPRQLEMHNVAQANKAMAQQQLQSLQHQKAISGIDASFVNTLPDL